MSNHWMYRGLARVRDAFGTVRALRIACQTAAAFAIVVLLHAPAAHAERGGILLFDAWQTGVSSTVGVDEGGVPGDDIDLGRITGLPNSESLFLYALGMPYQTGTIKFTFLQAGLSSNKIPTQNFVFKAVTFTTASQVRVEWDLDIKEVQLQQVIGSLGGSGTNQMSWVLGLDEFRFKVSMTQGATRVSEDINLSMPYTGLELRWRLGQYTELEGFVRLQPSFDGNTRGTNRELVAALKFVLSDGGTTMLRVGFRNYKADLTVEKSSLDDFRFSHELTGGFFGIEVRS